MGHVDVISSAPLSREDANESEVTEVLTITTSEDKILRYQITDHKYGCFIFLNIFFTVKLKEHPQRLWAED